MELKELLLSPDRSNHMLAYELRCNWSRLEWYEAFDAVIKDVIESGDSKGYVGFHNIWRHKPPWFVQTVIKSTPKRGIYWGDRFCYTNHTYLIYNDQQLIKLISVDDLRPKSKSKDNFKLLMQRFKKGLYEPTT